MCQDMFSLNMTKTDISHTWTLTFPNLLYGVRFNVLLSLNYYCNFCSKLIRLYFGLKCGHIHEGHNRF